MKLLQIALAVSLLPSLALGTSIRRTSMGDMIARQYGYDDNGQGDNDGYDGGGADDDDDDHGGNHGGNHGDGPGSTRPSTLATPPTAAPSQTAVAPNGGNTTQAEAAIGLLGDTKCSSTMCVAATVQGNTIEYSLSSTQQVGWMAMGFGRRMTGSPIVFMYPDANGVVNLSHRITQSYTMPAPDPNPPRTADLLSSSVWQADASSGETTRFTFTMQHDGTVDQNIIYAFGRDKPTGSGDNISFRQHSNQGTFTLNLVQQSPGGSNGGASSSNSTSTNSKQAIIIAHAVMCSLAFVVFLPSGALLGRYMRTFSVIWFRGHWIINFLISGTTGLIGIILAIASINNRDGVHLNTPHKKLGLALVILYIVQCSLGGIIHFFKPAVNNGRPPQNYTHAVLGLTIIGLSLYQVRLGYAKEWVSATGDAAPAGVNVVWTIWTVLLPVAYAGGLMFLKKQYRLEAENRAKQRKVLIEAKNSEA